MLKGATLTGEASKWHPENNNIYTGTPNNLVGDLVLVPLQHVVGTGPEVEEGLLDDPDHVPGVRNALH